MYSQMSKKEGGEIEDPLNSSSSNKNNTNNNNNPSSLPPSNSPSSAAVMPLPSATKKISDKEKEEEESNLKEYARLIGINPENEQHLMWIAEEGFTQPLSDEWKTVETEDGDFYFVNRKTGLSTWEHPMDEHFRKMADHWRSNVTEPLPPIPSIKTKPKNFKKIPAALNIVKVSSSPTSPECPELLSSGSEKEKVYSSDSGTFDTDEEDDMMDKLDHDDEEDKKDYFYLPPNLNSNEKEIINDGSKRVTFSKNLVKVYEFDTTNMHWIRSNVFRKDGSDPPQPIKEYLDGESSDLNGDKATAGQRPSTPRMIPTERYERLRQVQKRADAVINRNWREFCNAVTESYARAYQLASTVPSRPSSTCF